VAFPWTSDVPVPTPMPSPIPPRPTPTPTPAPKSSAGAVVGTLVALAAVGALVWFGVERFYPGGRAALFRPVYSLLPSGSGRGAAAVGADEGFYAQLTRNVGWGGAERPTTNARTGMGAHPLFAAGGGGLRGAKLVGL